MMKLNNSDARKLGKRVEELEAREVVLKDQDFIGRKELTEFLNGFAAETQQALNNQYAALSDQYAALTQQVLMGQEQNAKAVRVAEARARQIPQQQTPPPEQMAVMMEKFEALQRQIGG